jgi:uncharacterized protein with NAD-binding domain and iron-sulfur cluster
VADRSITALNLDPRERRGNGGQQGDQNWSGPAHPCIMPLTHAMTRAKHVVVIGGGVAGLTVAHELGERGFRVTLFDRKAVPGGKARSVRVPCPPAAAALPGEHGFRFFPGFYRHVRETMCRIPLPGGGTVADRLVPVSEMMFALETHAPMRLPCRLPRSWSEGLHAARMSFGFLRGMGELGLTAQDLLHYAGKLWRFGTSCDERRLAEHEAMSWWKYVQADERSAAFRQLLVIGVTRNLVAAQAETANARTVGLVALQLLRDLFTPGRAADCILSGPTNDVWIDPWVAMMVERHQLDYRRAWELEGVTAEGGRVVGLKLREAGAPTGRVLRLAAEGHPAKSDLVADHFVLALPVEAVARLCQDNATLVEGAPALAAGVGALAGDVGWMNGVQFFLTEEVPLARGHINLLDSAWALTAISHTQFWSGHPIDAFGDGSVKTVLSVDISHFAGVGEDGLEAWDCSREALARETWRQLKRGLNRETELLRDEQLHPTHPFFVDDSLAERAGKQGSPFIPAPVRDRRAAARTQRGDDRPDLLTNAEPLLVNKTATWDRRPDATTALSNLFLAGDYLRTHTNLATMEAANESGRRAANAILAVEGKPADCAVLPLDEPFAGLRAKDRTRFARRQPWASPLRGIFYYLGAWGAAVSLRALFLLCLMSAGTVLFGLVATVGGVLLHRHFGTVWPALFHGACAAMSVGAGRMVPDACHLPVAPPSPAALSVFCFGLYALCFGLSLGTLPKTVLARLGFPSRQGPWMALVGAGPALVGLFYVMAALFEVRPFFWILVFARAAIFLFCMRLRYRQHQASALLSLAALPDLLGAFWTAWALAGSQARALGLILGISNVIVACALALFPTETRWRLGFERQAGTWLPLAAVLLACWGIYEIVAAVASWWALVWMAVLCRVVFGGVCLTASFAYGIRRGAVESPWRLKLAGLAFWGTAALLAQALLRGV